MLIKEYLKDNLIYLDGGMGTLLQAQGLKPGELPERWNLTHGEVITAIHKAYFDAGSNVVNTNTFGANILKFDGKELEQIVQCAVLNAKRAKEQSCSSQEKWIALDIGPTGRMLKPYGDLDFEEAINVFAHTIKLGVKYGVDLIMIETMNDSYETKAAVLAAKENCDLPVFVSNAYQEDGTLMTGANPEAMVAMLEGLGVDALGVNCSFGPKKLAAVVEEYLKYSSTPVLLKPNAGLPRVVDGKTVYDVLPKEFAIDVAELIKKGVRIAGGCCGTTPDYIKELVSDTKNLQPTIINQKEYSVISSYSHAVIFGKEPILVGERINPTGKKKFKEALKANDINYVLKEGINQQEKGVHVLDVNVGLPEIDEEKMLLTVIQKLQAIVDLPLQIDTSNVLAMESALRAYNGKAMINSVNGKKESMDAVFPLVKKYGGVVVCLTLDENGIPKRAEERLEIAKKICKYAEKYGIAKKDLIFDPLALTVSAEKYAAKETLKAVNLITKELNCNTILGVSNVSFGLPCRDIINGNFFALALEEGLSLAIINPYSKEIMQAYYAFRTLKGLDDNCQDYVAFVETLPKEHTTIVVDVQKDSNVIEYKSDLQRAIIKGQKEEATVLTKKLLENVAPLDIVNEEIIPALNKVGVDYENKRVYLPQLLMSAEASKCAFLEIKEKMQGQKTEDKGIFVIATVKGDIHDIGKNIVKLLLENYGFNVVDLGKDVEPKTVVEKVVELHAPIVGLSALMTTTVPAMEETIKLLRKSAPWCKVMVGGAVLNKEYAKLIGADYYAKDGMEGVRYAMEIVGKEV
ncbi:MAG: homocysteine S-methyltransferase family protein [Clostridia bacterium]|nr:homocysteine S-methyltransferase family protein [Clostridia bacterium]